ncbi:MAG: carbohydrate-binding domain-containing protein [Oscillospiraceae bacterium]|nr:carbohydrate-binding domain-containing protein [Oscillospiraceae bacterium]
MKKTQCLFALLLVLCLLLCACSEKKETAASTASAGTQSAETVTNAAQQSTAAESEVRTPDPADLFTLRDLDGSWDEDAAVRIRLEGDSASCDSSAVQISGATVTIAAEGVYVLTGTLSDGEIIVNCSKEEKVQLVLNGAEIHSADFAAIYVAQADKVFLTLADGTVNTLTNGGSFTASDESNVDAVIFAKDDLTINGSGALLITSPGGHGVVGKDEVTICGGSFEITSAKTAISGKDSLSVSSGVFKLIAGTDAMKSENDDTTLGNVYLAGGSYNLSADGDGVSASGTLTVAGGSYTVLTGSGGNDTDKSQKGMKAGSALTILDGTIWVSSTDDSIHSNGSITVLAGTLNLSSGDDGVHADDTVTVAGGSVTVRESYEGIEGLKICLRGGELEITASDDGLNAGGGGDSSGYGGRGGDMFSGNSDALLEISGGTVTVNAGGDGLDTNGSLNLSGGTVTVYGPTNDGNGSLDYGTDAAVTGGSLIALGSSGMAVNFRSATQGAILLNVGSQSAGTTVTLTDADGNVLLSCTAEKAFAAVNLTCPELAQGGTYTVTAGAFSQTLTLDSLITGSGGPGGPGGFGGRR